MNIRILCVGSIKERYFREAAGEYLKRLSRYADASVSEAAEEKAPERLSTAEEENVRRVESERLLSRLGGNEYVIAMDGRGREVSSNELAQLISAQMSAGSSRFAFLVGGSLGLHGTALERADCVVSFGRPTYPHQLFRVLLLEQIYRAFRIMRGEPYHK